ncbi:MAG: VTT domain-containing protein [Pseudolabrys sp.]
MGGFCLWRQYWVFDWQDNLSSNDYPLRWELASLMHASVPLKKNFSHYGSVTVLVARFFPVLRQLNGIVAGVLGMSWWRFLLFNAIGAALWVGAWVFIVYFSAHTAAAAQFANNLVFAAGGIGLIVLLAILVVRRLRRDDG